MLNYDWCDRPLAANRRPFHKFIMTPNLTYAHAMLCEVDTREPGDLTFVLGPSGAAKTGLWKALPTELFGEQAGWPDDRIPIISTTLDCPDLGFFSWPSFTCSLLEELLDPFRSPSLDRTRIDPALYEDLSRAMSQFGRSRTSAPDNWKTLISIAQQVGLRHIAIDEASLLTITQQTRLPSDFIQALRAAALKIKCTVILFGTFELLDVIDFSATNNRRELNIQIERLLCDTKEQQTLFLSVAEFIADECGVSPALVRAEPQWFYDACYGIVGELEELFERARIHAKADGSLQVKRLHIQRAYHRPEALARMRFEADEIDRAFGKPYAAPRPKKAPEVRAMRRRGRRRARRMSLGTDE